MPLLPKQKTKAVRSELEDWLAKLDEGSFADLPPLVRQALHIARLLQQRAGELQTPAERRQQSELDRMMQSPGDKATIMQLTDQTFRSEAWARSADQMIHVLDAQGVPRFFSPLERTMLHGFQSFGGYMPGVAMPLVKEKMRHETANVVLPAEEKHLRGHLNARHEEGVRMNVNHLGEALLGEREAARRMAHYLELLRRPEIEVVSVKISTIYSQILPLAREYTVTQFADRLEQLYRASQNEVFVRPDGLETQKFVYLDMEEYRDMRLTAEAFIKALDRPGLENVRAGIVLQAYVPDSFGVQQEINAWARQRVEQGGAPITMRIVKGANMEMERVGASLEGWPQAPYKRKVETDANYLRMIDEGMKEENIKAVRLGVASHNLFTLAYGLVAAAKARALDLVQFEMLEGIANHQRRALFELSQNLLLYAPTCEREEFVNAIGYLIRRLDENTGPDNFLRHAFNIEVDSDDWHRLEAQFVEACKLKDAVSTAPRRTQNRSTVGDDAALVNASAHAEGFDFYNEPDTDWSLCANAAWAESLVESARERFAAPHEIAPAIAGNEIPAEGRKMGESIDPSRPEHAVATYVEASEADVDRAVAYAMDDPTGWRSRSFAERRAMLERVADEIASRRGELLGVMLAEGGKLFTESDPEVSEAIDFCRWYGETAERWSQLAGVQARGRGVVAVVSPWNFPLAIPCGGVAGALAAGNTVILKPASDTVLIARELCECFWRAGVPREALQFVCGSGTIAGRRLVTHADVDSVILTGGTETAMRMLADKPDMRLFAETGGKNATIVTAMADRDLAIKNVIKSAFGHSGQKCSATSLLILEDEVYHDRKFRDMLADAAESLRVGSAWDLASRVGPLIRPPSGDLKNGLTTLEGEESWLLEPRLGVDGNPHLVSPAIKWDVAPESTAHGTEFFGPLLGVMRAANLTRAIELVNATGFGLTSGLESLDDREHEIWREHIRAGNLYINRSTTGAIVLRQPFGGMGKSNVGPGIKAGGPNYVAQFMHVEGNPEAPNDELKGDLAALLVTSLGEETRARLQAAIASYRDAARDEFRTTHDAFKLVGEDNLRRYLPVAPMWIRITATDTPWDIAARIAAAYVAGCRTTVSVATDLNDDLARFVIELDNATHDWGAAIEFVDQTDTQLAQAIAQGWVSRVRYAAAKQVPVAIRQAAAESLAYIAAEPVSEVGRYELLWYVQEQAISHAYHRYGNLGLRSEEPRHEPT